MRNKYLDELLAKYGHLVWNKWNAPSESTTYIEFQRYLTRRLKEDSIFAGAVMSLKGHDLKCYCSNGKSSLDEGARYCHGLVLLHAADLLHLHDSLSDVVSILENELKNS